MNEYNSYLLINFFLNNPRITIIQLNDNNLDISPNQMDLIQRILKFYHDDDKNTKSNNEIMNIKNKEAMEFIKAFNESY